MVVYRSLCNARRMDARDTVSAHSWECDVCTLNCTLSETVYMCCISDKKLHTQSMCFYIQRRPDLLLTQSRMGLNFSLVL